MTTMNRHPQKTGRGFDMQFVTSCISTTLVLVLVGMVVFFVLSANNLSNYVKENIGFSILLDDDMSEAEMLQLQKLLASEPFTRELEYISKDRALAEQTELLGTDPQEFLEYNPFKASIEVKLKSDYANTDSIARIEQFINGLDHVSEINYQKDLVTSVNTHVRTISLLLLGVAALLTLISFVLINNTIRLSIFSQRRIIYTMKLVGASWGFIRRPFLLRHFWMGILAACLAGGLLWGGAWWLLTYIPGLSGVVTVRVMLGVTLVVLLTGVLVTWICALFSVNRCLRMGQDVMR